jgi:transcriptional regulator with XRE-family HTH domain
MEGFTCPNCGKGEIVMATGRGRRMRYRHIPDLELPEELELPTCSACGEGWIDVETSQRLEVALEAAYRAELARKAERAIEALRPHIPQRDLERLLGVSAGWLSKVKNGKETSAPLAALLMLLAERPHRVDELHRLWAVQPESSKVVEVPTTRAQAPMAPAHASLFAQAPMVQVQLEVRAEGRASADVQRLVA